MLNGTKYEQTLFKLFNSIFNPSKCCVNKLSFKFWIRNSCGNLNKGCVHLIVI